MTRQRLIDALPFRAERYRRTLSQPDARNEDQSRGGEEAFAAIGLDEISQKSAKSADDTRPDAVILGSK